MKKITILLLTLHTSLFTLHAIAQWLHQYSGTDQHLNDVYFLNHLEGWVVGNTAPC